MRSIQTVITAILLFFVAGCNSNSSDNKTAAGKYGGPAFKEHVRSTPARSPEEERKGFKLPEGFEITLFASEPQIGKPINIAFDARGRLWVTQSFEYPFAASPSKGRDRLTILEDTDNDGRADKFIHFNDTLNIPIGVMPVNDGAIVYSIPNVYRYTDNDGDGKPDEQTKLFGPFEYRDTHGMVNNFIIGYDGWVHACHGYTNRSKIAGADGDTIRMTSGNTFRFRRDGSRVEHTTDGRINPFGLTYDELGCLYSTDCHTSPLYQLIRGGDYTQWGKENIMGFAPDMKPLENEATALAGIAYYADTKFPEAYRGNFYIGDVVACRVYRNSSAWKGSSPVGKKEEDFLLSEDPWFRPVDVKLGPDGALYIADFYNSIIGHYEVPLDHPKRDKTRGRIWRITYKGKVNKKQNLAEAPLQELLAALNSDNLPLRLMAADQMVERIGQPSAEPAKALINKSNASPHEYVHALWVLQRLNALTPEIIQRSSSHSNTTIRLHALRVLAEQGDKNQMAHEIALKAMTDADPHVQRAATELLAQYVTLNTVEQIIAQRKKTPGFDTHLVYTQRLALRSLLRNDSLLNEVVAKQWSVEDGAFLCSVMPGVQTAASGQFLFNYVKANTLPEDELERAFKHIARFIPGKELNEVIHTARQRGEGNAGLEYVIFRQVLQGFARRGIKENDALATWGRQIASQLLPSDLLAKPADDSKAARDKLIDKIGFAMNLAGRYKLKSLQPQLLTAFGDSSVAPEIRIAAMEALMKIDAAKHHDIIQSTYDNTASSDDFRRRVLTSLAQFPGTTINGLLQKIKTIPPDLHQPMAIALAASPQGIDILFEKVKKGEIFPRTLIQPKVEERLMLNMKGLQKAQYETLTTGLENINKERQSLVAGRITDFRYAKPAPSPEVGRTVFMRNCTPCHSVGGEGGSIGPQLDGVGKWGATALIEKILDPNRNVSESFRNYTIQLRDGKQLTGLYRREEGEVIVFADVSGQEFSVAKNDIAARTPSKYTLMPDQFSTTISPEDFNALIAYLLTIKN